MVLSFHLLESLRTNLLGFCIGWRYQNLIGLVDFHASTIVLKNVWFIVLRLWPCFLCFSLTIPMLVRNWFEDIVIVAIPIRLGRTFLSFSLFVAMQWVISLKRRQNDETNGHKRIPTLVCREMATKIQSKIVCRRCCRRSYSYNYLSTSLFLKGFWNTKINLNFNVHLRMSVS